VSLDTLGGRRPATRYIWRVIFRQRVSAARYGVPHLRIPPQSPRRCDPSGDRSNRTRRCDDHVRPGQNARPFLPFNCNRGLRLCFGEPRHGITIYLMQNITHIRLRKEFEQRIFALLREIAELRR
jgi:hypothetical protein